MVAEGYKHTKLGYIPLDWKLEKLGDFSFITKLAGFEYSKHFNSYKDGGEVIVVRGTNITHNRLDLSDIKMIPKKVSNYLVRSKLFIGDLVFAYVGTIGPVWLIDENDKYHLGPNTCKITVEEKVYSPYILAYFKSWLIKNEIIESTSIGAQPSLSMTKIRNFNIILPPKEEQKAIATALSDVDELIASLERLMAKKEDIKTATMQQLLTGKKRLDGFSGEWVERKLGDIGEVLMCKRIFSYETSKSGSIPFYKIGTFGKQANAFITEKKYLDFKKRFSFPKKGDILISASGTIGRTIVYDGKPSYFQDSNIVWIENDENIITNKFLYHVLQIVKYESEGSTIQRLYNSIIKKTSFMLPPKQEQSVITTILSDMDKELEAIKARLEKTKAIKVGMMQELLTGKTRLL